MPIKLTLTPLDSLAHSLFHQKEYYKLYTILLCSSPGLACNCCKPHLQFLRIYSLYIHNQILNKKMSFKYKGDDPFLLYLSALCETKRIIKYKILRRVIEIQPFFIEAFEELQSVVEDIDELERLNISDNIVKNDFHCRMFIHRYLRMPSVEYYLSNELILENEERIQGICCRDVEFSDKNNKNEILGTSETLSFKNENSEQKLIDDHSKESLSITQLAQWYRKLLHAAILHTDKQNKKALDIFNSVPLFMTNFRDLHSNILYINNDLKNLSLMAHDLRNVGYTPEVYTVVGNFFSLRRDHAKAIKYYNKSIKLSPRFSINHTLIGHEYVTVNNLKAAVGEYTKAIKKNPYDHRAYYGLGLAYSSLNQHVQSVIFLTKCSEIYRDPAIFNFLAEELIKIGQDEKAMEVYKRGVSLGDPISMVKLGDLYKRNKMYTEAVEYYEMYLGKEKDSNIQTFLDEYYKRVGRKDRH